MQKKDMLPILYRSAALFEENLAGRTFLFIAQGADRNAPHLLEARFERRHFLHFTGCKPVSALPAQPHKLLCVYAKRSAQTLYPAAPVFIAKELRGKTLVWPEMVSAKLEPVIL